MKRLIFLFLLAITSVFYLVSPFFKNEDIVILEHINTIVPEKDNSVEIATVKVEYESFPQEIKVDQKKNKEPVKHNTDEVIVEVDDISTSEYHMTLSTKIDALSDDIQNTELKSNLSSELEKSLEYREKILIKAKREMYQ